MDGERGQSLVEVLIAVALVTVLLGTLLLATLTATHRFVPAPEKVAVERAVARELAVAVDILKYQGAAIPPASIATTLPLPTGTPLPVHMSIATQPSGGGVNVTVTATTGDGSVTASTQATIAARAPYPGSTIPGGSGAAPVAAPTP